jgi:glycogen debranching enzyme
MSTLIALDGSTFFVADLAGDVEARRADGFFHCDMRHLSHWKLLANDEPPRRLSSDNVDYYSARIVGAIWEDGDPPSVAVRRERFVADGVHEDLVLENLTDEPRTVELVLEFGSDFGDILECRKEPEKRGVLSQRNDEREAVLRYERDEFVRETVLRFSEPCELIDGKATFHVELAPRETWQTCVDVVPVVDGKEHPSRFRCGHFGRPEPNTPVSFEEWMEAAPELETDWDGLRHTYERSLADLAALHFRQNADLSVPAGGLPWFMALFGRDSIHTAFQLLPFLPDVARATLSALASLQATARDDFRDAEPGKILHELRHGELTVLGDKPHSPYYGAHDTTPLFLVLLDEYERWSGDTELVRSLEPAARAALHWLEEEGDLDGDGFLEYEKRSPEGLYNQGWKDSWNAILFADGTPAEPPIATCELQGYAYDALRRSARLARDLWDDAPLAERLATRAGELRDRFDDSFWIPERGHYALALDGREAQVGALTSNIGHLLWSGIVAEQRAPATVERLRSDELFTGWGIRTMSSSDAGYNALEYHNGTVWPFDTALAAEGMRRYGFADEAGELAVALLEAAERFDGRLPELFAGFPRAETGFPVEYAGASRPQSFSAGAPLMALRTLLGPDPEDGSLCVDPAVPERLGRLALRGVRVRGRRFDAG